MKSEQFRSCVPSEACDSPVRRESGVPPAKAAGRRRQAFVTCLVGFIAVSLMLAGCRTVEAPEKRRERISELAMAQGWHRMTIPALSFDLTAFAPVVPSRKERLIVFIEGDGLAWLGRGQASQNPTPIHPIGLNLAISHPQEGAVYLARPCQFEVTNHRACAKRYWTSHRFGEEVIAAFDHAIDALKARFEARHVVLVGYSGGGAIAALLGARRQDVSGFVTIAGNLDHLTWTRWHRVSPLAGSLNPVEFVEGLSATPQVHFIGGRDTIVPSVLVDGFLARQSVWVDGRVRRLPDFDHDCCWVESWPKLWMSIDALFKGESNDGEGPNRQNHRDD